MLGPTSPFRLALKRQRCPAKLRRRHPDTPLVFGLVNLKRMASTITGNEAVCTLESGIS
jgi:hypothetical protein